MAAPVGSTLQKPRDTRYVLRTLGGCLYGIAPRLIQAL